MLNSNAFSTKIKNKDAPIRCKNDEKDILLKILKILKNFLNILNLLKTQISQLPFYRFHHNLKIQPSNEYQKYESCLKETEAYA